MNRAFYAPVVREHPSKPQGRVGSPQRTPDSGGGAAVSPKPQNLAPIIETAQVTAQAVSDFKKLQKNDLLNIEKVFPTVTAQVTAQVTAEVLLYCQIPRAAREIMAHLGLSHWKTFQTNYLKPLLEAGAIERTIPNKPKSPLQKYRITNTSLNWLETIKT